MDVFDGVEGADPKVVEALELAREKRWRLRIWHGDTDTGRPHMDEHDVLGYVGRSMGPARKVPLLIYNSRSLGGAPIMAEHIVRIDRTNGSNLYRHPKWQFPNWHIDDTHVDEDFPWALFLDGNKVHSRHYDYQDAYNLLRFLRGDIYSIPSRMR